MNRDGQITLIVGRRRFGKTSWLKQETLRHDRVLFWDWRGEYDAEQVTLEQLPELFRRQTFKARYVPNMRLDLVTEFHRVQHLILHLSTARFFSLVVDEAYLVCPDGKEGALGNLMRLSGPSGLSLYVVSHRPVLIPGVFRSEADRIILFHLHNPTDLQLLDRMLPAGFTAQLPKLQKFQFIEYIF